MYRIFYFFILIMTVVSCSDGEESVNGLSGKYTYMGFDMPTEYNFYAVDQNGNMSSFDVVGSSLEDEYDVATASSNEVLSEIETELIDIHGGTEIEVLNEHSLVYAFNSPSDPSESYSVPTSYSLNGDLINIEGVTSTDPEDSNWLYQYDDDDDLIFLTLESIIFSDHDPELNRRRVISVVRAGEVIEGDLEGVKSKFSYTPTDSIGIGFGRIIYKKE